MKKSLKAILFTAATIFAIASFGCKSETNTEYVEVEKKPDSTPPQKVITGENAAIAGNSSVLLSWKNPADEDFYGTKITFTPATEGVTQPLVIIGEKSKNSSILIRGLQNGTEYTFSLSALDKTHNEAQKVELKATPVDAKTGIKWSVDNVSAEKGITITNKGVLKVPASVTDECTIVVIATAASTPKRTPSLKKQT